MKNVSFYEGLETTIAVMILCSAKEAVVCWWQYQQPIFLSEKRRV